jgi:hypothetical protein
LHGNEKNTEIEYCSQNNHKKYLVNSPFHPKENSVRKLGYFKEIEDTEAGGANRAEIIGACPEDEKTYYYTLNVK